MNPVSTEVSPEILQKTKDGWRIAAPSAQPGGGMFAVVADWCGHCKTLKSTVAQAQRNKPFDFFYMTGDKTNDHKTKSQQLGVEGFPTTYFIGRNGVLFPYNGARSVPAFNELFSSKY